MEPLERTLKITVLVGILIGVIVTFISFGIAHAVPWILSISLLAAAFLFKPRSDGCDEFLAWTEEYATGIKDIDEDHKKLLNLINNLQAAVLCNTGETFERYNLEQLVAYTQFHFAREEKLMEELDYINYEAHKGQHDQMILKVKGFVRQYDKLGRDALKDVPNYLRLWLVQHINHTDKQYVSFFKEKGVV
jgi:hemerythrin-like metal-binding protein